MSETELSPERPERVTLLVARTAVEVPVELLLVAEEEEPELLLLTVVPELEERVPLVPELEEELERVTCWLELPVELLLVDEDEEEELERVA